MKMKFMLATASAIVLSLVNNAFAQNTFPSAGNVGIGTTTPANKLTVKGDAIGISNESANGAVKIGFYVTGASAFLQTHTNHSLNFATNNGAVQATLLTNGNFGIGTSTPAGKLDVTGGDAYVQGVRIGRGRSVPGNSLDTTNTAFGRYCLESNVPSYDATGAPQGYDNTAVGYGALRNNTTGSGNTAVGHNALSKNTEGLYNIAIGRYALESNLNGYGNVAAGAYTLRKNRTGSNNISMGVFALQSMATGRDNVAMGPGALQADSTGSYNIAIGSYALSAHQKNNYIIAIGRLVETNSDDTYNSVALGSQSAITASNQVRIGNNTITSIGGYANWTNISDARVKRNIKANVPGLDFINKLTPVTYNLDLNAADKIIGIDRSKTINATARKQKEQQLQTGFLAQDVEKAAASLGFAFSGVDAPKNDKDLYGLRYAEFVVPIVKAVQELSKINDEKDAQIKNLQQQIDELKEMMKTVKATNNDAKQNIVLASGRLEQNTPNPFNSSTSIAYTLPEKYAQAKIVITDKNGKTIKEIMLTGKVNGTININSSTLNSGAYQYSLYINNVLAETKQMVLVK